MNTSIDYTKVPHQEAMSDGAQSPCLRCLVTDERLASWLHDPKNRGEENLARIIFEVRELCDSNDATGEDFGVDVRRIRPLVGGGTEASP